MYQVSGFPMKGEYPTKVLKAKDATHKEIYSKYDTCRGSHGVVIADINDQRV
jgi:hypothetical protein